MSDSALFELIAQEAIMGIMMFCPSDNRCVWVNRIARETLELGLGEEVPGQTNLKLEELFPGDLKRSSGRAIPFSAELARVEGFTQEVLVRKRTGANILANVGVKRVVVDGVEERLLVTFQDITIQKKLQREVEAKQEEIKNAYTELLEQNKQLKELDNAKDRFIALTTHELRTPLSAIIATAEVLQLKLYESEEQKEEFIKTIHEQGIHLMELVNDILDFAKIRAGKMEFYVEQLDLVPLASKLATVFENMAALAQVSIEVRKPEGEMPAWADSLRLKEVLSNVVNNAIKYNRAGGRVVISFVKHESFARIVVADTGPGIAAGKIHHVFNEFETVGNVARHHKGTGLGMPISKRLMQGIGGDLSLDSKEGVGTSFFIDVPVEKVLADDMYRARVDSWGDLAA